MEYESGTNVSLGTFIRRRRRQLGLTQEELAARVGDSVRQSDISRLERDGVSLPRRNRLEHIARALDVSLGTLMRQTGWLDEAVRTGEAAGSLLDSTGTPGAAQQSIEVTCTPLAEVDTGQDNFVAITTLDVTEREQIRRRQLASEEVAARLSRANEEVVTVNQDLTLTISRLRDEYEQMAVAGAESQAATEEVETLNEKLQASNEELETLNEELQATVELLNTTYDDLHSRTLELQSLALKGEASRQQLRAIVDAIDEAIIVVDLNGSVILENACFTERFEGNATSLEFLDPDGALPGPETSPILLAARGETFVMKMRVQSPGGVSGLYEASGRPAVVGSGPRVGVVTIRPVE